MPQNGPEAGRTRHRSRPRHAPIARGIAIAKTTPQQPGPAGSGSLRELKLICLSNLLASTEERVYFKDLMSRFLFVSEGWIKAVAPGRTAAELAGKTDFDVFTEEHAASAFADEQEIIRTGEPIVGQVERETFSGRADTWVSTTKVPLRDDHGEIIGTFGISRDITAQIRAESALALQAGKLGAQNERLRELDRLKDEFVALVSHELRTPLTSIIGYVQLLRDERASGLDTDHFAEVIERNAERLLRLVGDLLFLSQMQSGQLALELRETDLAGLAGQAVEEGRPEAERKHIDLVLSAAPVPRSAVDPTRIAQLLGNLITNAVKFTPEGGKVEVRLAAGDGEAVLSVADTGIGILAADRERVFERFYRTEAATRRVIPGSGLGLTISRAIVDAHRGTITVSSDGKHGSTFTVRLPLALGSAWRCTHSAGSGVRVTQTNPHRPLARAWRPRLARRSGSRSLVTFQTRCDLPVPADRHQMHTVEGSAVADGQDLLARRVHPSIAVTLNVIDQLAGDIDVRDSGRQAAGHARAGQDHHPRIDRYLQAGALTPPQQGIDRETDLHECEVGCGLPRRNRPQARRDPDAKRPAAGERRIPRRIARFPARWRPARPGSRTRRRPGLRGSAPVAIEVAIALPA